MSSLQKRQKKSQNRATNRAYNHQPELHEDLYVSPDIKQITFEIQAEHGELVVHPEFFYPNGFVIDDIYIEGNTLVVLISGLESEMYYSLYIDYGAISNSGIVNTDHVILEFETNINEDEAERKVLWELPFTLESLQTGDIFIKEMPDYDPMVHYVDPYDFFGVIDDNWEEIGKAVYTEVVFVGPIHTEYNEPHPIFCRVIPMTSNTLGIRCTPSMERSRLTHL